MRNVLKMFLVLLVSAVFYACGTSDGSGTPPPSSGPAPTFSEVAPIIQANCAKCHNGSVQPAFTEANFKASKARDELTSGGMPLPPNQINARDKAALLAYLGT